jgi:transposase InsO family protein
MEGNKEFKHFIFSGKKEHFIMWQQKFLSYALVKNFKHVLTGETKLKQPDTNTALSEEEVKSNKDFMTANNLAYSTLYMCVKDEVSFGAIFNAMTNELPEGDAYKAWQNLQTIFKPVSSAKKHDLEQTFNKSSLDKESTNPDEWFAELERIRLQLKLDFNREITDDQMISQIVYNINPIQYKTTVAIIKRDINRGDKTINLEDVKDDIRQVYGSLKQSSKRTNETALIGKPKFKKHYKGLCRLCGKIGHKSADCWSNDSNKDKRPANYKVHKNKQNSNEKKEVAQVATTTRAKTLCPYCKRGKHTEQECWKKQADEAKVKAEPDKTRAAVMMIAVTRTEYEMLLASSTGPNALTQNTFICDSGASCHMRNSTAGMYDLKDHVQAITVGNSETIYSKLIGKFKGTIIQQDGRTIDVVLDEVLYIPDLWLNLISVTKALKQPHTKLDNKGELIVFKFLEGDQIKDHIVFDKIFTTGVGQLLGIEIQPKEEYANVTQTTINYEEMHGKLGHPNEQTVIETTKHYGINTSDAQNTCRFCATAKHKKSSIPKQTTHQTTYVGERINIDISYVNTTSFGGNKYWLLVQDSYTDYLWSFFLKNKSETAQTVMGWVTKMKKEHNLDIKSLRCDNSGENQKLRELIKLDKEMNIKFEFTAPNTPQQNGQIERKFQTLYGKIRSMLNWARLTATLRSKLWAQCANTATFLENIIYKRNKGMTSYEMLHGKPSPIIKNLRIFGEVAMVHNSNKIQAKLENKSTPALFIGYPEDHAMEVYEFLNLETHCLMLSRNYIWMNQSFGEYMGLETTQIPKTEMSKNDQTNEFEFVELEELDDVYQLDKEGNIIHLEGNEQEGIVQAEPEPIVMEQEVLVQDEPEPFEIEAVNDEELSNVDSDEESDHPRGRIKGVDRALRNLESFFNPNPWEHTQGSDQANLISEYLFSATLYDGNPEPKNVKEAKKSKDWDKWWDAMSTEFRNMEEKEVWTVVNRKDVPSGRDIIGNRWVFNIKDDGRYRARTVAKGYSQVPGKDFQENFAPVIHDTTFHIILTLKTMMNLKAGQFDIETAFLYGDLEEDIWMELPDGYSEYYKEKHSMDINNENHCLKLTKSLYGLVQAARQWWKKFKEEMKNMNYSPSDIDPCLFIKSKENGSKTFLILYVDDGGIFGTEEDIKETLIALRKAFKVKELGNLEHFVGCHLVENKHAKCMNIHQPKLLKHLREEFKEKIGPKKEYKTPAGPKTMIMRPQPDDPLITTDEQSIFRSGVGMLLYLVKHSRPDISNAVRELSKVCDGATRSHWKALMHLILNQSV